MLRSSSIVVALSQYARRSIIAQHNGSILSKPIINMMNNGIRYRYESSVPSRGLPEFAGVSFTKPDGRIQVRFQPPKFSNLPGNPNVYAPSLEGSIRIIATGVVPSSPSSSSSTSSTPTTLSNGTNEGRPIYDYDNQLSIRLGVMEILQVVQNNMQQPAVVHQKETRMSNSKLKLEIIPPSSSNGNTTPNTNTKAGLYRINITDESRANSAHTVSVHVTQAEIYLLRNLLGVSLPWVTGWQYNLDPTKFDHNVHVFKPSVNSNNATNATKEAAAPVNTPTPPSSNATYPKYSNNNYSNSSGTYTRGTYQPNNSGTTTNNSTNGYRSNNYGNNNRYGNNSSYRNPSFGANTASSNNN